MKCYNNLPYLMNEALLSPNKNSELHRSKAKQTNSFQGFGCLLPLSVLNTQINKQHRGLRTLLQP